jgi:hypothetical protein
MPCGNPADCEPLVAFYAHIGDEVNRLRDDHWRLMTYFVSEAIGVIYLVYNESIQLLNRPVLCFVIILQLGAIGMFLYYMYRTHKMLNTARQVRRSVERLFCLHELKDDSHRHILPEAWMDRTVDRWFEFYQVIIPLMLFTLLAQCLSIYMVFAVL